MRACACTYITLHWIFFYLNYDLMQCSVAINLICTLTSDVSLQNTFSKC